MTAILVVGNHNSNAKLVMEKLYHYGISLPQERDSKDNFSNKNTIINKIFSKKEKNLSEMRIINTFIDELTLSNIEKDYWGISEEFNFDFLEYFKVQYSDAIFILVFDHPKYLFEDIPQSMSELTNKVNNWATYHKNLLKFFEKHKDKTILVEGSAVLAKPTKLNSFLEANIKNLLLKKDWQLPTVESSAKVMDFNSRQKDIINEIINTYPIILAIFNKLLESAAIISSASLDSISIVKPELYLDYLKLIKKNNYLEQKNLEVSTQIEQYIFNNNNLQQENQQLIEKLHKLQEEFEKEVTRLKNILDETNLLGNSNKLECDNLRQENEQLIEQLHRLQEEFEEEITILKNIGNETNLLENNKLEYDSLRQENRQLIEQLHRLQEDFQQVLTKNKELVQSSQLPKYYGAVERVKQELPYRIGSTIIQVKKPTELLALPNKIIKEIKDYKATEGNLKELPSLSEYQDKDKIEKIKNHLSYKIGNTLVEGFSSPTKFVKMPMKMAKEVISFKKKH